MIYTEAITGISEDHYFDEYKNREFIPPEHEKNISTTSLKPYDIGLIRDENGNLRWSK